MQTLATTPQMVFIVSCSIILFLIGHKVKEKVERKQAFPLSFAIKALNLWSK